MFRVIAGPDGVTGTIDDNLRLLDGSTLIDAGDDALILADLGDLDDDTNESEATPRDHDLADRVDGIEVDMGAYEYSDMCLADFNDDCFVNAADLAPLLGAWSIPIGSPGCGGSTPCPQDLNGDGLVNAIDLAILLGAWSIPSDSPCDRACEEESLAGGSGGGEESEGPDEFTLWLGGAEIWELFVWLAEYLSQ